MADAEILVSEKTIQMSPLFDALQSLVELEARE